MKQSAAILALFLGATSAVQLRAWGDDKKEVVLPPEKVHNLKPTHAQDLSNNLDSDYPTFPQPIGLGAGRTAFYAQTGDDEYHNTDKRIALPGYNPWVYQFSYEAMPPINGYRSTGAGAKTGWHISNQAPNEPAYNSSGSDTQGTSYMNANTGGKSVNTAQEKDEPKALVQKRNKHRHQHHHHHKAKDIGDSGIAEEVQQFASADKSVLPQPWRRAKEAYPINGFKNPSWNYINASQAEHKHHHHHHHKAKDIGDSGIDEAVHGFASADKSVLPKPWRRAKEAYPLNGFKNASWQWLDKPEPKKSLAQHHHHHHAKAQDIGDSGIDESVQQFASADKSVLPKPWRRAKEAYPLNGFKNASWQWLDKPEPKKSLAQQEKRDISDQGIDEAVHGFASNDKSVLPKPWRRATEAYPINGHLNPEFQWLDKPEPKKSLAQKVKKDISDQGIDEAVHGFASNDKSVLPQPWRRAKEPYPINGSLNPEFQHLDVKSLAQKTDIGDKKIAEEVHGFINNDNSMHPTPYPREEHSVNGVLNPTFQHLNQKQDIGNSKYVRPDVYHFVNENIGQVPTYRRKTAPKHKFEAGKSGQGIDIVSSGPSAATAAPAK